LLLLGVLFVSCATNKAALDIQPKEETAKVENKPDPNKDPDVPKLCALTFDDGPDTVKTNRVLDKLQAHGVVASFFVVGQRINNNTQPVLKRAVDMGCEIHNHSWAYDGMTGMSEEAIKESISKTTAAIEEYAGVTPLFFRPPNLSVNNKMFEIIDLTFASGVLGMDWAGTNTNAEQRAQNVINGMKDGAIILLHDVQPEPHPTPEALDILIPQLKAWGYQFVTLSQLFVQQGVDLETAAPKMWKYVK
jgi:peptidoglycan/xylan/chitin deacetylase (PgdA/CDA1 family)